MKRYQIIGGYDNGTIKKETEKAFLINNKWIAKSQIKKLYWCEDGEKINVYGLLVPDYILHQNYPGMFGKGKTVKEWEEDENYQVENFLTVEKNTTKNSSKKSKRIERIERLLDRKDFEEETDIYTELAVPFGLTLKKEVEYRNSIISIAIDLYNNNKADKVELEFFFETALENEYEFNRSLIENL